MKRKGRYYRKQSSKGSGKALSIILLIVSLLMIALIIWIAMNDWDVRKSAEKMGLPEELLNQIGLQEKPAIEPITEKDDEQELKKEEEPVRNEEPSPSEQLDQEVVEKTDYIEGQPLPAEPTYIQEILIVNKKHPLPKDYAPGEDAAARAAFDEMVAEASQLGHKLTAFSTYRSFEYQTTLYNRYVERDGKEAADRYSARPGYSEHQTGLAFDIGEANKEQHWASESFGETEAGKWVASNAHRYGFILRYPKGKEAITGYMHESWHFRYVGKGIAEEIFKRNVTLEEYVGLIE